MRTLLSTLAVTGLALVLTACSQLPGGAPLSSDILQDAQEADADFAVYAITREFLPTLARWPVTGAQLTDRWIGASQGAATQRLQPGDRLSLRIWDSSDDSLLTPLNQKDVQLQDITIGPDGTIFMPYVGQVSVRGMTPDLARQKLQSELEIVVPSAQLQLELTEGRNNAVDLVSGVNRPGSYPLPDRNFTVTALIAAGGGIPANLNNPQVRLVRGGRIFGTSVAKLLQNPALNTRLMGGDQVHIRPDDRTFLSFGATGREDLHLFPKDTLSAMEAVALIGGLQDNRADPKGLLILRDYANTPGKTGPEKERVIFTLDLTSADGLFSAGRFQVHPGDLVMATEAPINDAVTLTSIFGNLFSTLNRAQNL